MKKKDKKKNNIYEEDSSGDSSLINQKKNLSSTNKYNQNKSLNNSNSDKKNNINSNPQVNPFKKNKKKHDKNKDSQNSINKETNNIKFLNNSNKNMNNYKQINLNINKQKEPSNQQKLEEANNQMQQMNYTKAEQEYKLLYENCSNYSNQFLINLLNNYSICLYNQGKYEESAQIATKIILEYDNRNKRAYLTILSILYNIKEYNKAVELIEKIYTIFKKPKDFEMFKGIINDINLAINEEEDNKQREIYYNREKKIIDLVHNKWVHFGLYGLGTFIGGCLLYKFIHK